MTNIERLVTAGTTLTVEGENGAKLVFDADSLKGISEQAEGSVEVTMPTCRRITNRPIPQAGVLADSQFRR